MNNNIDQNWLLLRGLARESAHWGDFVPLLQSAFPQAKIHTLDLPGTGHFHHQQSPNSIEAILETVREHARQEGFLAQPITLLALSLGGMVAWEWMRKYPQDVCASVLINSSFANLSPFYERLRWQSYGKFIQLLLTNTVFDREREILRLVSNQSEKNKLVTAQQWADISQQRPISFKNSLRQMRAAACYRPDVKSPSCPVLLLNSLGDRLVSPACSTQIQQKWNLPLYSHPTAGHDLPLDAPDWLIEQLQKFSCTPF